MWLIACLLVRTSPPCGVRAHYDSLMGETKRQLVSYSLLQLLNYMDTPSPPAFTAESSLGIRHSVGWSVHDDMYPSLLCDGNSSTALKISVFLFLLLNTEG